MIKLKDINDLINDWEYTFVYVNGKSLGGYMWCEHDAQDEFFQNLEVEDIRLNYDDIGLNDYHHIDLRIDLKLPYRE